MTRRRAIVATLALLVVAFVIWRIARTGFRAIETEARSAPPANAGPAAPPGASAGATKKAAENAAATTLAATLNSPTTDIRADLRLVSEILDTFRTNFPHDGNPTGTNDEITAALTGRNRLELVLIPPDHPAINRAGELCDRWGTPFFFHAESASRMEIRSAGPDRRMWTDDDVVFTP